MIVGNNATVNTNNVTNVGISLVNIGKKSS